MISRYKLGDHVVIKQKSVDWHYRNNKYSHTGSMDRTIGKEGIIFNIYRRKDDFVLVIDVEGERNVWEYSENCVEPFCNSITSFGKFINDIYIKEIEK